MFSGALRCLKLYRATHPAVAHMIANCLPKPDPPPMYRVLLSFASHAGLLIPAITCDQDATTGQLGWSNRVQSIDAPRNRFHLVRAFLSRTMRTCIVMISFLLRLVHSHTNIIIDLLDCNSVDGQHRKEALALDICASRYTSPPFHSAAARTTSLPTFTAIAPSASQLPRSW
jgi:hypothetical protein